MKKKLLGALIAPVMAFTFTLPAYAEGEPAFVINDAESAPGEEFTLRLNVENGTELAGFRVFMIYDEDAFTLKSADPVDYESVVFGPLDGDPFTVLWLNALGNTDEINGCFGELTFEVNGDTAPGEYDFSLHYNDKDVIDIDGYSLDFELKNATVTVEDVSGGDTSKTTKATKATDKPAETADNSETKKPAVTAAPNSDEKKTDTSVFDSDKSKSVDDSSVSGTAKTTKKTSDAQASDATDDYSAAPDDESGAEPKVTSPDETSEYSSDDNSSASTNKIAEAQADRSSSEPEEKSKASNVTAIIASVLLFGAVIAVAVLVRLKKKNK